MLFLYLYSQVTFYIQDSDDVYGLFRFDPRKKQSVQSQPEGRFLSLHFLREGGTLGAVSMTLTALYIPTGPVDPARACDQVLNVSSSVSVVFARERTVHVVLPIRNDAFLQNGAHFLLQVACQVLYLNLKCTHLVAICGLLLQTTLKKTNVRDEKHGPFLDRR